MAVKSTNTLKNLTFVRISLIPQLYGVSRSTVYRLINDGQLPQPQRVTSRLVGFDRTILDSFFLGK